MSSRTTSTSKSERCASVVIALGSNLGDRRYQILRALHDLRTIVRLVRVSALHETEPFGAPAGSPDFLNAVAVGYTALPPVEFLRELLAIELRLGRVRRGVRNAPRTIDLDLIVHGGHRISTREFVLPHPRAHERSFVMDPLRELGLAHLV